MHMVQIQIQITTITTITRLRLIDYTMMMTRYAPVTCSYPRFHNHNHKYIRIINIVNHIPININKTMIMICNIMKAVNLVKNVLVSLFKIIWINLRNIIIRQQKHFIKLVVVIRWMLGNWRYNDNKMILLVVYQAI